MWKLEKIGTRLHFIERLLHKNKYLLITVGLFCRRQFEGSECHEPLDLAKTAGCARYFLLCFLFLPYTVSTVGWAVTHPTLQTHVFL